MSLSVKALCVDPERANEIWPYVRDQLKEASKHGLSDFKAIEQAVLCGESLLWIAVNGNSIKAAAVTELLDREGDRECCIALCGGEEMTDWLGAHADIERYARDERCKRIVIIGRCGWERALVGYRRASVILEKELG